VPTEPPTEPHTEPDYYPDSDNDYWKSDDDYWGADTSPSPSTDPPHLYWKPDEGHPSDPVTDAYVHYWKSLEEEPSTSPPIIYDDFWKEDYKEPYSTVTDNYDTYWQEVDPTPGAPGKVGTDGSDYWDATRMFGTLIPLCFVFCRHSNKNFAAFLLPA
ncbi:hypothetical protein XENOCAPTIV_022791, partial [Xenoophorus captivus]